MILLPNQARAAVNALDAIGENAVFDGFHVSFRSLSTGKTSVVVVPSGHIHVDLYEGMESIRSEVYETVFDFAQAYNLRRGGKNTVSPAQNTANMMNEALKTSDIQICNYGRRHIVKRGSTMIVDGNCLRINGRGHAFINGTFQAYRY